LVAIDYEATYEDGNGRVGCEFIILAVGRGERAKRM